MKRLSLFAAALFVASLALTGTVLAGTGNGPPSGPHYNLNLIGFANGDTVKTTTGSGGNVIFTPLEGNCKINLTLGDFDVLDNNCTDGTAAAFQLPNPDPTNSGITTYSVFVRALGKPQALDRNSYIHTCAFDPTLGYTVCSVTYVTLHRDTGQQKFTNVSKELLYVYYDIDGNGTLDRVPLFGTGLQDFFWSYDNDGLRLAQLRFYPGVCTMVPSATNPDGTQQIVECPAS